MSACVQARRRPGGKRREHGKDQPNWSEVDNYNGSLAAVCPITPPPKNGREKEDKYGNGRAIKIMLKTSYGSISLRRTSSDDVPAPPHVPHVPKVPNHNAPIPEPEEN